MYLLGILLILALSVNCNDNKIANPKRSANEKEFPYLCLIKRYKQSNGTYRGEYRTECSGTLLSMKHVLTAAKCVEKTGFKLKRGKFAFNPEESGAFRVIAGTIKADEIGPGAQIRKVEKIIAPKTVEREDKQHYKDDIAILSVKKDFDPSLYVIAAPFLKLSEDFPDDESAYCPYTFQVCVVPGWGHQSSSIKEKHLVVSSDPSTVLKVAYAIPLKLDECTSQICGLYRKMKSYGNPCKDIFKFSWSKVFCGLATDEADVCYFDQGSPMVCEGVVIGFVTFVDPYFGCGRGAPAAYVSLRAVLNFIKVAFPKSDGSAVKAFWILFFVLIF